jgi:hypothetical protein
VSAPRFDPAAALAAHVQARATAAEAECRDASCQAATSHPETCECACEGASHGRHQDRTGLMPAAARTPAQAGQPSYAMRSMMAAMPDDEAW